DILSGGRSMRAPQTATVRPTSVGMRRMLLVASILVFIVGIQLFILSEQTDRFFAWTIQNPLTAAFLGGAYWASFAMEFLAAPRQSSLPGWVRAVLLVHAVIMIPIGLVLLIAPQVLIGGWPWALTPLTGRAIGAWSLALGVAAAHALWENDWARVQVATMSYTVFGVFELLALARYP